MNLKPVTVLITPSSGGKDYFLEILQEEIKKYGKDIINIKFATMVREIIMKVLFSKLLSKKIITKEQLKSMSKKQKDELFDDYKNKKSDYILWQEKNVRNSLQHIAETLKKIDKNIHIAFALIQILKSNKHNYPVITDCRFENEMNTMIKYNTSVNKEEFIRKFISNIKLPNKINLEKEINTLFNIKNQTKEDKKIIKLIIETVKNLYSYRTFKQEENKQEDITNDILTKEDFFDKNIIILTRYITEFDIESQKKQYKEHNIDFNAKEYKIEDGKQRYLGSANPTHISEQLSFKMPTGFLNATNSPNLKNNLLPIVVKKILNQKNSMKKIQRKTKDIK